jgi:hypothetical protein
MRNSSYTLGVLANFLTLAVGIAIGFTVARTRPKRVYAAGTQKVQEITPGVTTGSFGAGLILAHEIQADRLVVNGYDLLKMHQNTLNYLLKHLPGADRNALQSVVEDSKVSVLYRVKPPASAQSKATKQEKK